MKHISASLWLPVVGCLSVPLYADVLPGSSTLPTNRQTQSSSNNQELSWPMDKILKPSFHWAKHYDVSYPDAVEVFALDSQKLEANQNSPYLYSADLHGESFEAPIPMDSKGKVIDDFETDCGALLKEAGYSNESAQIPDKHVLVGFEMPPRRRSQSNSTSPESGWKMRSYLKRVGPNIRLVLVGHSVDYLRQRRSTFGTEPDIRVFVSDITPLEQILKKHQLLKNDEGLKERRTISPKQ